MPIHLPNGLGGTSGDSLITRRPLDTQGCTPWYVHYGTGSDAASPRGKHRFAPLQTLAQAVTNASSGDIIVLMDGHEETFTSAVTVNKDLTIVGEGTSGGRPTVKLTNNQAGNAKLLNVTASNYFQLRNVWLEENLHATLNSAARVFISNCASARIDGCYMQCGDKDGGIGIQFGGAVTVIQNCTFVCTSTTTSPNSAVGNNATNPATIVVLRNNVFDGNANPTFSGYSTWSAVDMTVGAAVAVSNVWGEGNSFIRGATYNPSASGNEYHVGGTFTGSVRLA
jgi:hypothetical protein